VSSNSIRLDSNSDQFSESATKTLSMRWSIYPHRLIYQWTWFYVHMQIVSLLQWQAESWSLRWASQLVSLLQWHSSSMQWSTYLHRLIYQWTWFYVHVQIVSLLQWHSSSMQWSTYSHRSIYQWINLPRVHMQLVSLLQWSLYLT